LLQSPASRLDRWEGPPAGRSDRREGPPAGRKQQSAGESRRVADGDGFKFQNVRCVRECVGGVTEALFGLRDFCISL